MTTTAYLHRSSAVLPCTAGQTPNSRNPYITRCQLRQTLFWSAVLAAALFAINAVLAGMLLRQAKRETERERGSERAGGHIGGDADADSLTPPPTYREKDGEAE